MTRPSPWMLLAALMLAACSPSTDAPAGTNAATPDPASWMPDQAEVDRFVAEGPDPTLRELSVTDYWLHYKLMQATGIEQALGGETQAVAALQALGDAYERQLRGAEADLPKMIPASFTGEGMASGFTGMGMGGFLGMMTGGMVGSAVSSMSDAQLAELVARGPIKFDGNGGNGQIQVDADGSLAQSMEFEVNEHGLNGKVKIRTKMEACPDPQGKVTVEVDVDSQMSVSGKPGTGGYVRSSFKYERYLDDEAHLIDSGDGGASNLRVQMGGHENFQSQGVDITTGHERGGKPIFENHGEQGYSIFRPEEVERTQELLRGAEALNTLIAEAMLRGLGSNVGSPWESGRCIDLKVTSSPAKRKGIKPSTAFDLEAMPRAKADGAPAGGTVTATLTGGASLQPATGKVRADAKYGYAGPEKKDEEASIAFESRSKRGVGRASAEFDTKAQRAYRVAGGGGQFSGSGTICDLEKPFTISGSGVTVLFTPSSAQGGTYSYQGNMSGFAVWGGTSYTVSADENGGSMTGTGNGCVKTPMGTRCANGTEKYTLTPTEPCEQ